MPRLIDYADVVRQMTSQGLVSLYPNSGAFGFPSSDVASIGWIGPDDPTIRPAARVLARSVASPDEATLAALAGRAWQKMLAGPVWVMPKSHWAYELMFGSSEWLPSLLASIGVTPESLRDRHDGTAVEFADAESSTLQIFIDGLLGRLLGSDFLLAFPGRPMVCTIHHHKQLWWTSPDRALISRLEAMVVDAR